MVLTKHDILPRTHRALKVSGSNTVLVQESPLPKIELGDVLVRVHYVALNPVDCKSVEMSPTPGATVGCDFAGEIVQLGEAVHDEALHLGTRVCGCVFGNNPGRKSNGAFAEYVAVPATLVLRIPESMSYQSAATLGIGLATVGLALYNGLRLEGKPSAPAEKSFPVLVSGAGTATGALAVQVLKL